MFKTKGSKAAVELLLVSNRGRDKRFNTDIESCCITSINRDFNIGDIQQTANLIHFVFYHNTMIKSLTVIFFIACYTIYFQKTENASQRYFVLETSIFSNRTAIAVNMLADFTARVTLTNVNSNVKRPAGMNYCQFLK